MFAQSLDLTGPKPTLIKEQLQAPAAPPAVARLIDAAQIYHTLSEFERATRTYQESEELWTQLRYRT